VCATAISIARSFAPAAQVNLLPGSSKAHEQIGAHSRPGFASIIALRGFVANRCSQSVSHVGWDFAHVVFFAGVLRNLAHDFFFVVSFGYEIAVTSSISTANGLCHKTSFTAV
jgi:hypothetical protein